MAQVLTPFVSEVLERVRDPQGSATSDADVRLLFTTVQRALNVVKEEVLGTYQFTTEPMRGIYDLGEFKDGEDQLMPIARIKGIRLDGKDLNEVPWTSVVRFDRGWVREQAATPISWASLSRLFLLYPVPKDPITLEITYVRLPASLLPPDAEIELPNESYGAMLDRVEALLLLRMRKFALAKQAFERGVA